MIDDSRAEFVIERLEGALLADRKVWKERKQSGSTRPLRKWHSSDLAHPEIYERVRVAFALQTKGQALALIGTEIRIRKREGRFG